ncbi:MAG: MAPEG family protein [Gammaproteobacteria bacterium]|nr:MAPEG family protein [Gammaproteobacteria bacterium]
MSNELYWLTLTALFTGLCWFPYIANRLLEIGIGGAALDPNPNLKPKAPWAQRMKAAHANGVENLVVFAPLVLIVHITDTGSAFTAIAVMVYFFARIVHYLVYTFGVPGIRTLAFSVSVVCQLILALAALGLV